MSAELARGMTVVLDDLLGCAVRERLDTMMLPAVDCRTLGHRTRFVAATPGISHLASLPLNGANPEIRPLYTPLVSAATI